MTKRTNKTTFKERIMEIAKNFKEYEEESLKSFALYHLLAAGLGAANGFCLARGMNVEALSELSLGAASVYGFMGGLSGIFMAYLDNCGYENYFNRDYIDADVLGMIRDVPVKGSIFAAINFGTVGLENLLGTGIGYGIGYLTNS